ncbi:MAG: PQQ-binding-like beta-propeller repeat protein, partial [Verrucomicrobiota bacterium]
KDDEVLYVNRAGALQATAISDGSLRWERRLPDSTWASPLLTEDYLYFFCKNGTSVVFERSTLSEDSEPAATNLLTVSDEDRVYGYAAANGTIVIRTGRGLIAVKGE